jgi:hypothetical protein
VGRDPVVPDSPLRVLIRGRGDAYEHWLPLSEDERRLLLAVVYAELDAAEENVRDFEVDGPPEALDGAQNYATLVRRLYERIRDPRQTKPTQS